MAEVGRTARWRKLGGSDSNVAEVFRNETFLFS